MWIGPCLGTMKSILHKPIQAFWWSASWEWSRIDIHSHGLQKEITCGWEIFRVEHLCKHSLLDWSKVFWQETPTRLMLDQASSLFGFFGLWAATIAAVWKKWDTNVVLYFLVTANCMARDGAHWKPKQWQINLCIPAHRRCENYSSYCNVRSGTDFQHNLLTSHCNTT